MVKSLIKSSIEYPEYKTLYDDDKDYEASMYKVNIMNEDVIIALGQAQYTFVDKNVLYYPIYLVKNNKVDIQMGVYEIAANKVSDIIDEDGDVEVGLLGEPLLFSFINRALLMPDADAGEADAVDASANAVGPAITAAAAVSQQTEEDALKEQESFKDAKDLPWIQKYMKNNHYKIVNNEGKGDCLFAAIRDGLKMVGINISVEDMRKIIAEKATNDIFLNYKELYEKSVDEDKIISREIKLMTERHNDLKKQINVEKDRNTQMAILEQAKEVIKRHKELKQDRAGTRAIIEEFKFIKGIKNIDMFKLKLQTCDFWGDTWAISTLEHALNIKLILLSRAHFKGGDVEHVITCGQENDVALETAFKPDHYIMLDYDGSHYQLITYKELGAFTFKELPYDFKVMIVNKCLEREAGPYYSIPEFKEFMTNLNLNLNLESKVVEETQNIQSDLFDNSTVFQFYTKSLDAAAPGKGAGETVGPEGPKFYSELSKITSWRRKLDNAWPAEFTLEGKKWLTVEHYYQGSKFKRNNPNFYAQFSLDSGSAISKDVDMAEGAASKNGKYKGELLRPKEVTVDKDFFEVRENTKNIKRANLEMQAAIMAKFSQHEELKRLLKATKKAKLQHFSRGLPPEVATDLMVIRATFV